MEELRFFKQNIKNPAVWHKLLFYICTKKWICFSLGIHAYVITNENVILLINDSFSAKWKSEDNGNSNINSSNSSKNNENNNGLIWKLAPPVSISLQHLDRIRFRNDCIAFHLDVIVLYFSPNLEISTNKPHKYIWIRIIPILRVNPNS